MNRRSFLLSLSLALAAPLAVSAADAPARFRWAKGDAHTYKVAQTTRTTAVTRAEEAGGSKTATSIVSMSLVKRWDVTDVDAAGVGTLTMTVVSMRLETRKDDGAPVVFDSAAPAGDDAAQMAKYVGKPVVTVRLDALGKVVEVKDSQFGPASRLEADLPFKVSLPEAALASGATWTREYSITQEPPAGTGERHAATQTCTLKEMKGAIAVIGVVSALKTPPLTADEKIPLMALQQTGDVYVDTATGRLYAARLKAVHEVPNFQGEGTKFAFEMVYSEDLAK